MTTNNTRFDQGLAMVADTLFHLERDGEDDKVIEHLQAIHEALKPYQERQANKKKAKLEAEQAAIQQAVQSSLSKPEIWRDNIFSFLGMGHYAFVGAVNKQFKQIYKAYCETVENPPLVKPWDVRTLQEFQEYEESAAKWDAREAKEELNEKDAERASLVRAFRLQAQIILKYGGPPFLDERPATSTDTYSSVAARNGHLDMVKWARENGCPWNEQVCEEAAGNGHLDTLKFARENGCPWNKAVCVSAARNGHLDILKWARENGCPWNQQVCQEAAGSGHLDILNWARENGCPWNEEQV